MDIQLRIIRVTPQQIQLPLEPLNLRARHSVSVNLRPHLSGKRLCPHLSMVQLRGPLPAGTHRSLELLLAGLQILQGHGGVGLPPLQAGEAGALALDVRLESEHFGVLAAVVVGVLIA